MARKIRKISNKTFADGKTYAILTENPTEQVQKMLAYWEPGLTVDIGSVSMNLPDIDKLDVRLITGIGETRTIVMTHEQFNDFMGRKPHLWLERMY